MTDSQQPTQVRRLVLALACSISFTLYLHRYTWGFIKQDIGKEFGWGPTTLAHLDNMFIAPYGAAQVPSGMLCDWFGAHLLLGSSVLLWSLALGSMAIANSLAAMSLARFTFGAAQAGCYPVLNKVSKNWFPPTFRSTAQGWIASFFGRCGGAVSFLLFSTVMLGWCGMPWRMAIGIFTAIGVGCGVLFILLYRNTPREHPWANEAEAELIVAGDPSAAKGERSVVRWSAVVRSVSFWFLLVRAAAANMADLVYVYWIPTYLLEEKGLTHAVAGWLAALPLVGGALGGLFSGWLQSWLLGRQVNRRWVRSGVGLSGKMLAAAFMLSSLSFSNPAVVLSIFLVVKFFSDWEQPAEWGAVSDIAGSNAATVFACVNMVGAIGAVGSSLLIAKVLQFYGVNNTPTAASWTAVFAVTAIEYVVAALAWLFIDSRKVIDA